MNKSIFIAVFVLIPLTSHAKLFQNSYVSFQLPPNWNCSVKGTEWVCKSSNNEEARQAIIVLTAKEVGPNDHFAYYNQYLKTPKTPRHRDGSVAVQSKVQHLRTVQIANHPWVDGLHFGSLLPNFYSRYLVTIKDKIAVLVTFSAKKEFYTRYSKHFFDAINSLRVMSTPTGGARAGLKGTNESLGVDLGNHMDEGDWADDAAVDDAAKKNKKGSNIWLYGLALVLASAGFFFMIKKKK